MELFSKKTIFSIIFCLFFQPVAANSEQTLCSDSLLTLIDRPTFGDSACVAIEDTAILETGYQYQKLSGNNNQQNFPSAFLRMGLPNTFEVNIFLPAYYHQTVQPFNGIGATYIGIKKELSTNNQWVTAIEGYLTLPSGDVNYGSRRAGGIVNWVFIYSLTSELNLAGMFGVGSQSDTIYNGGQSYSSVNPDLVLSWSRGKVEIYGEIYGQSSTGAGQGNGFYMDAGIIYLLRKNIAIDFELGHKVCGEWIDSNHYVGAGLTFQFN